MSVIDCLLQKAQAGIVSKKTAASIIQEMDSLRQKAGEGLDVGKELDIAQQAFDTITHRLSQKAKQTAIHADLVEKGTARFKEGVPTKAIIKSFSFHDEANGYKYGYSGPSASERVAHNQRMFISLASEALDNLNPTRAGKFSDPKTHMEIKKDLFASLQGKGERSLDPEVRAIADTITNVTTRGAEAFERAGGNITLRKDFMLGRSPVSEKILKASKEDYIKDSLAAYDLAKVSEATGGAVRTSKDLADLIAKDYGAIESGGIIDMADFAPKGMKSVVNSRNHHRIFHFKDAEAMQVWQEKYGDSNIYQQLMNYTQNIGKDIGILETFGPKPEAFLRTMLRKAAEIDPGTAQSVKDKAYQQFRQVTGQWDKSLDPTIDKWMQSYRQTNVASMLGTTAVSAAIADTIGLGGIANAMRGLPALKNIAATYKRAFTPGMDSDRKEWARLGWLSESFTDDALAQLRASEAEGGHKFTRSAASAVMKYTGLSRWTAAGKGTATRTLGEHLATVGLDEMPDTLVNWLATKGIDKPTLARLQEFGTEAVEKWGGLKVLSPIKLYNAGMADDAALLSTVFNRIQEINSPTSSPEISAWFGDMGRGSKINQVVIGSLRTFSGYPGSFYHNHLRVLASMPGYGDKLKWTSAFATSMVAANVVEVMLRDMLNGKDPALNSKTITRAIGRANIVPYLGEFLLERGIQFGSEWDDNLRGVLTNQVGGLLKSGAKAIHGDGTGAATELQRVLENFIPGKSAWFAGLALKRTMLDQMKYLYDPAAAKKFKRQAQKSAKEGSPFWWAPGETAPDRAPNLENIVDQPFLKPQPKKRTK